VSDYVRAECRSCLAAIIWATTSAKNRPMPVDYLPHPDGTIRLRMGVRGPIADVVATGQGDMLAEPLRHSHFTTCPEADKHRRPR
jgi:hypothetical protein